jgi:hypothetical protein
MSAVNLNLSNLGDLSNGEAGVVINAALAAAVRDCEDRGLDDKKPRTVTITVSLEKISDDSVSVEVQAKTSLPAYRTNKTIGTIGYDDKQPAVRFQPLSADRPDQDTFPFPEKKAK